LRTLAETREEKPPKGFTCIVSNDDRNDESPKLLKIIFNIGLIDAGEMYLFEFAIPKP
jgi:hypothetical protein